MLLMGGNELEDGLMVWLLSRVIELDRIFEEIGMSDGGGIGGMIDAYI